MWTRGLLGTDIYHIIMWFIVYSVLGWLVESIYMSFCNHKITNRGFAKGPFCPIYGFGAVSGYFILQPITNHCVLLYITGAVLATIFEFLVAKLMLLLFGEVWWDYNDKPLNYKGIICLESTIAWGFYAIILCKFLQKTVMTYSERIPENIGIIICKCVLVIFALDFGCQFARALRSNLSDKYLDRVEKVRDKVYSLKSRF